MSWKMRDVTPDWRRTEAASGHQKRFEHVLDSGLWCDVIFLVGTEKRKIGAHKLILRIGSEGFERLFKENGDKNSFEVPDLEPEDFNQLLKFLYTGEMSISTENCLAMLSVASRYQVFELVQHCGSLLVHSLTGATAIKVFQAVSECGEEELEEEALKWICRNANTLIESPSFLELSTGNMKKILVRDSLEVKNELQLFEAVIKWGQAECKRQMSPETPKFMRSALEPLLHLIRFPLMDASDFSLKVATAQVLLPEEIMAVLLIFKIKPELRGTMTSAGVFSCKTRTYYSDQRIYLELLNDPVTRVDPPTYSVISCIHRPRPLPIPSPMPSLPVPQPTPKVTIPKGTRFRLRRLENCTGYIDGLERSGLVRFKPSSSIWLTNIGVNGSFGFGDSDSVGTFVQFQLRDMRETIVLTKREKLNNMNVLEDSVHRVPLTPVYLLKDEWYFLSFEVIVGTFLGSVCDCQREEVASQEFALPDGSGRMVKFEFQDEEQHNGNIQCFLLEIGFMMG